MKFILIIICCLTILLPVHGTDNDYTLPQLLKLVAQKNLVLRVANLDKKIALEEYRGERALPNPELEYSRGKFETEDGMKMDIDGIGVKWAMPNPIHRMFRLKAEKKNVTHAEIEGTITKNEIKAKVKSHFYKLGFYMKLQDSLNEKHRILEEVHNIIKAKVSVGESKAIDQLRSSVEIQKIKTEKFKVSKAINFERNKLNEMMNNSLPNDFTIATDFHFKPLPLVEKQIQEWVANSPIIKLKKNKLEQQKSRQKSAATSIIEEIEIFAEREKEPEGKKWKVGIGIAIPIFNPKLSHIRKARWQKEKARLELQHARKHFLVDIHQMMDTLRILEKEVKTFQGAILEEGKQNMELSGTLYKEGEISLVVFLDSRNSYYDLMERYYEAITEWRLLKTQLEEQLGEEL